MGDAGPTLAFVDETLLPEAEGEQSLRALGDAIQRMSLRPWRSGGIRRRIV